MIALALRLAPYIGAVLLVAGAVWWIYSKGGKDERNSNAGRVLVQTEDDRKLREKNDAGARGLDDDAALLCLRNPAGCKR